MKLNKERKIFVALLALGLGALAVDRMFSGAEAAASSDNSAALVPTKTDSPGRTAASPTTTDVGGEINSVAARLNAMGESQRLSKTQLADGFQLPPRWAAAYKVAEQPAAKPLSPVERFQQSHKLNAVMVGGRRSRAIVDGTTVSAGQVFDGFRLVEVTERFAVLESDAGRVVLKIVNRPDLAVAGTTP
jgi:hypothetical protein